MTVVGFRRSRSSGTPGRLRRAKCGRRHGSVHKWGGIPRVPCYLSHGTPDANENSLHSLARTSPQSTESENADGVSVETTGLLQGETQRCEIDQGTARSRDLIEFKSSGKLKEDENRCRFIQANQVFYSNHASNSRSVFRPEQTPFWRELGFSGSVLATPSEEYSPVVYTIDDTKPDGTYPSIIGFMPGDRARKLLALTPEQRCNMLKKTYNRAFKTTKANDVGRERSTQSVR